MGRASRGREGMGGGERRRGGGRKGGGEGGATAGDTSNKQNLQEGLGNKKETIRKLFPLKVCYIVVVEHASKKEYYIG